MPSLIRLPDLRAGYVELVRAVRDQGDPIAPRGVPTRELLDVLITIDDVTDVLPVGVGRGLVPAIGVVEALQLIAGRSTVDLVCKIAPTMRRYTDDDAFWGAYGVRIAGQLEAVARRLRADPDTRQAVITLWDPSRDNIPGKHDYPCTVALQFTIRRGQLHMHVTMRSNDVWLGIAYDAFQFTQLQLTLFNVLGVEPGTYNHRATSLHLYESNLEQVEQLHEPDAPLAPPELTFLGVGSGYGGSVECSDVSRIASQLLTGRHDDHNYSALDRRFADVLAPYQEG